MNTTKSETEKQMYQGRGVRAVIGDQSQGALAKYQAIVVGKNSFAAFLKFELITSLFGPLPGAVGLWCRQKFYPFLFRSCGHNVLWGRNLTIRNPGRINVGSNAVFDDYVTLDAKGTDGQGIVIQDGVFVGKGTVLATVDGTLELDEDANIGSYCRITTRAKTRIGKKSLIAAYVYLVGADHETADLDIPILDQPTVSKGGVQVGDGCWLGTKATVKDGVKIGDDVIVGAHSLVTNDLPRYAVAAGTPAQIIRMRK